MALFDPKKNPILAAWESKVNARNAITQALHYVSVSPDDTNTQKGKTALLNAVNWLTPQQLATLDFSNLDLNGLIHMAAKAVEAFLPAFAPFVELVLTILDALFPPNPASTVPVNKRESFDISAAVLRSLFRRGGES
jgi:hypothetical protein